MTYYIRFGDELPSGDRSSCFVSRGPDGLVNMENKTSISYQDIRDWFKTKPNPDFKRELGQRLGLRAEELEVVCSRLFTERDKGLWDNPFESEAQK